MNDHPRELIWIDRLASGELEGAERQELFAWLDDDPSRWRRCALALLEARELAEALEDWHGEVPAAAMISLLPNPQPRRVRSALALAASIMIAFSLGLLVRGFSNVPRLGGVNPTDRASSEPAPQIVADKLLAGTEEQAPAPTARVKTVASTADVARSAVIPPYVRSQLERQGYQLRSHPVRVPVVLPDGRRTTIAADELQVSYVGQQTY